MQRLFSMCSKSPRNGIKWCASFSTCTRIRANFWSCSTYISACSQICVYNLWIISLSLLNLVILFSLSLSLFMSDEYDSKPSRAHFTCNFKVLWKLCTLKPNICWNRNVGRRLALTTQFHIAYIRLNYCRKSDLPF